MAVPELAFAESLRSLLSPIGHAELVYITAEFQPFSNAQRPDVLFVPSKGAFAGQSIFLEIKLSTKPIQDSRGFRTLLEHLEFAVEALERPIHRYIYVTNDAVPELTERLLQEKGIVVYAEVTTVDALVGRLRRSAFIP